MLLAPFGCGVSEMSRSVKITCSIGIMAHNEAANAGKLLDALIHQQVEETCIKEIIVVASGCVDSTEEVIQHFAQLDPRIKLFVNHTGRERPRPSICL